MGEKDGNEDGSKGGGGNSGDAELLARIQRLISREGGTNEAITTLLTENAGYRDTIRDLKNELSTAKGKVPEGSVVLTPEQAKAWSEYEKLGKPEDLQKTIEGKTELEQRLATTERGLRLREAAEALSWDAEALGQLAITRDGKPLDFEIPTEEIEVEEGKKEKRKVPYIVLDAEKQEKRRLTEHAKESWGKFLPVLSATEAGGAGGNGESGTRMPGQVGGRRESGKTDQKPSFHNTPKLD